MQITIICPSSLTKDSEINALCSDYIKRITGNFAIIDTPTKIKSNDGHELVKQKQAESILKLLEKLPNNTAIIALDERGRDMTSPQLATQFSKFNVDGYSSLCFVIGGAFGLASGVLDRAHLKLSFGKMVWPHRLVGVMLLEQIYRAQQINAGHPYHKE